MSSSVDRLLDEALRLPENERMEMAASLLESVEPGAAEALDETWRREVARRVAEIDSGAVTMVPWSEARHQIFGT